MAIKAVVYDLDGTIVDTEGFHKVAWDLASEEYQLGFSGKELVQASLGISSIKTLQKMLPSDRQDEYFIKKAAEAKFRYFMELIETSNIEIMQGVVETFDKLRSDNLKVAICTSARKENVEALQRNRNSPISQILESLEGKIAWKEMYQRGKPAAEPLLIALDLIGIMPHQSLYVGDAHPDYGCAMNAGTDFVYFWNKGSEREIKIPSNVVTIRDHRRLFDYLEGLKMLSGD